MANSAGPLAPSPPHRQPATAAITPVLLLPGIMSSLLYITPFLFYAHPPKLQRTSILFCHETAWRREVNEPSWYHMSRYVIMVHRLMLELHVRLAPPAPAISDGHPPTLRYTELYVLLAFFKPTSLSIHFLLLVRGAVYMLSHYPMGFTCGLRLLPR